MLKTRLASRVGTLGMHADQVWTAPQLSTITTTAREVVQTIPVSERTHHTWSGSVIHTPEVAPPLPRVVPPEVAPPLPRVLPAEHMPRLIHVRAALTELEVRIATVAELGDQQVKLATELSGFTVRARTITAFDELRRLETDLQTLTEACDQAERQLEYRHHVQTIETAFGARIAAASQSELEGVDTHPAGAVIDTQPVRAVAGAQLLEATRLLTHGLNNGLVGNETREVIKSMYALCLTADAQASVVAGLLSEKGRSLLEDLLGERAITNLFGKRRTPAEIDALLVAAVEPPARQIAILVDLVRGGGAAPPILPPPPTSGVQEPEDDESHHRAPWIAELIGLVRRNATDEVWELVRKQDQDAIVAALAEQAIREPGFDQAIGMLSADVRLADVAIHTLDAVVAQPRQPPGDGTGGGGGSGTSGPAASQGIAELGPEDWEIELDRITQEALDFETTPLALGMRYADRPHVPALLCTLLVRS